jgi:predicted peroxiredoxin
MMRLALALSLVSIMTMTAGAEPVQAAKPKILVHLTSGPENPTKAALAFLVARTAIEQGHSVAMFLAGDAVQLLRDAALDNLAGLGTGKLREHFDAIAKGGGRFYLSGMSSSARGLTAAELQGKPAELAPPAILLKLALENDRMFTY